MQGRSIIRIKANGKFVAMGVYETLATTVELYNILGILIKNSKGIKKLYPKKPTVQAIKLLETLGLGLKQEERAPFEKESIALKRENPQFGYITLIQDTKKRRRTLTLEVDLERNTFMFNAFKPCTLAMAEECGFTPDKIKSIDIDLENLAFEDFVTLGDCIHRIFRAKNRVGVLMPVTR